MDGGRLELLVYMLHATRYRGEEMSTNSVQNTSPAGRWRLTGVLEDDEEIRAHATLSRPRPTVVTDGTRFAIDHELIDRTVAQMKAHRLPAGRDGGIAVGPRGCFAVTTSKRLVLLNPRRFHYEVRRHDILMAAALGTFSTTCWSEQQSGTPTYVFHLSFLGGRSVTLMHQAALRAGSQMLNKFIASLGPNTIVQ